MLQWITSARWHYAILSCSMQAAEQVEAAEQLLAAEQRTTMMDSNPQGLWVERLS